MGKALVRHKSNINLMPKWRTAPEKRDKALRETESHAGVRTKTCLQWPGIES